jgi:glyoxylase I family protein
MRSLTGGGIIDHADMKRQRGKGYLARQRAHPPARCFPLKTAPPSSPMAQLALHHVNVIVTDLPRSLAFYQNLLGLTIIERPPFKNAGAWLACGALQVHLSVYPPGSFRTGNVDGADSHFAFRTDDFDGVLATLTANGFREDAAEDEPMRVMVRRNGPAGFPQLFLLDPDRNIVEINGAP